MNLAGNLLRFFIYSNLFIACCAVVMTIQVYDLLLDIAPSVGLLAFIFFATICSYSFHWYLTPAVMENATPRERWLEKYKNVHLALFFPGLAGVVISSFFLLGHWPWLLLSALITFLYSAPKIPHRYFHSLRKVALAKTIFLAFVWMYVTTILPLEISDKPWRTEFTIFAAARFFLIYAICILFDYRDREHDKKVGIRSLITWLSYRHITVLFVLSLLVFGLLTCLLWNYGFSKAVVILLLLPGLITAMLYRYASRHFSDMLYYFILDGLMALSPLLTIIFSGRQSN